MNLDQRPVSATLVRDLVGKAQQYGILFWLDKDAHYTTLVDALTDAGAAGDGPFPGPVVGYRGSYLELMLALEQHGAGLDKSPLLVHLPGATEDTVHAGPLLELYMAGFRVRKALRTALKEAAVGRVAPEDVEAFLDERGDALTLDEADQWLFAKVKVASSELEARLEVLEFGPLIEDLSQGGAIARKCVDDAAASSVRRASSMLSFSRCSIAVSPSEVRSRRISTARVNGWPLFPPDSATTCSTPHRTGAWSSMSVHD